MFFSIPQTCKDNEAGFEVKQVATGEEVFELSAVLLSSLKWMKLPVLISEKIDTITKWTHCIDVKHCFNGITISAIKDELNQNHNV